MDRLTRQALKRRIDVLSRERAEKGYLNCDPEYLTTRIIEARELDFEEVAQALQNFRDKVVNPLLGEGWTIERVEEAMFRWMDVRID